MVGQWFHLLNLKRPRERGKEAARTEWNRKLYYELTRFSLIFLKEVQRMSGKYDTEEKDRH
jgi:hypothetical protein